MILGHTAYFVGLGADPYLAPIINFINLTTFTVLLFLSGIGMFLSYLRPDISKEEFDEAISVMQDGLANCNESGDMYYITAHIYKMMDDYPDYELNMNDAIRNFQTLSIPVTEVKEELRRNKEKF